MMFAGIAVAGLLFMFAAKREAFPKIEFDFVLINAIYPGATAEDIEKHVTIPVEDQLREVDGIDELTSSSLEARSVIVIKLDPDLSNKDKTINDIKNAVDRVTDLPEDVDKPTVTELSMAQFPVVEIAVINKNNIKNDAEETELRKYSKILEDRILDLNGVAAVNKQGYRKREMIVEVNPALLNDYHVAMNDIIMALFKKNLNFPGGLIKKDTGEVLVRTIGEVENPQDIRDVLIRANDMGNPVKIGDVARVLDSFEEEKIINNTNSRKSVTLTVIKKESADIITLVNNVKKTVNEVKALFPEDYEVILSNDMSYYVTRRLDVLTGNGITGFILVAIMLILSYGWRISLFTALAIPFSFFITIIWMGMYDVSINLMSMFGLIMALGMLVDNNIVVSDNIYRHMEEGWSLRKAVVNGSVEVLKPVAGTVLTTIVAFAPLMFMSGIMGKFIWTLPAVVSVALIASWLESGLVLPVQIYAMQKMRKAKVSLKEEEGGRFMQNMRDRYLSALSSALKHRYIFVVLMTVFFIGTVIFGAFNLKFILFPPGGIEVFVVKAEAPVGTNVQQMNRKLAEIESVIASLPKGELDCFTSRAGIMQEEPNDPNTKRGSNYGVVLVYLTPEEDRKRTVTQIIDDVRKRTENLGALEKLEFAYRRNGPPQGKPVSISVKGDDFTVLKAITEEYKKYLSGINGVKDITDNFEDGKDELRIKINEKNASIAGISVFDIASTVRSAYEGSVATTIKKTDEKIDIRVILPEKNRRSLASLSNIKVANRMGNLVPLEMAASFEMSKGISVISRKGWRRAITVTADIDEKAKDVTALSVNLQLQRDFSDIAKRYPGYTVDYEGEFRDTEESMGDLARSFIIATMGIYIILVALFRSLLHPIVIMGVIPLTFLSVIWTFFFHSLPLSFLGVMGVVGLAGVVVNNSIVFMDFINLSRKGGMSALDASIEAGRKRLRPIILSSITTVFGLLPTAYGIGGYDPFLVPMALSMAWGLAFGTLITLFATPVLYNIFEDIKSLIFSREKLEHAYDHDEDADFISADAAADLEGRVKDKLITEIRKQLAAEMNTAAALVESMSGVKKRKK
jgi:multidrug efflux pump subunit AcrB